MTKQSFFFYGMYEGNEEDPVWRTLHDHFRKLEQEDDDSEEQARADDDGMPKK